MRAKLIVAAILLQFAVLGWMAGQREWIASTGQTVWLRTEPVDPRDPFRGDYVTLNYGINTIPSDQFSPALRQHLAEFRKSRNQQWCQDRQEFTLCVSLEIDERSGLAQVKCADVKPPSTGPWIKGRVKLQPWPEITSLTDIDYGIDAYFVQQGQGLELERRAPQGAPDDVRVPMEMQVALGTDGTAVLVGQRWAELGIGLTIDEKEDADDQASDNTIPRMHMTFYNAADTPQTLVLPPDLRTLHLEDLENESAPGDAGEPAPAAPFTESDLRVLQPGESTTVVIDLSQARWLVRSNDGKELQRINAGDGHYRNYRITYLPPAGSQLPPGVQHLAPGPASSRQFRGYEIHN